MRMHECDGTPDCFACRVRSVQFAPSAMPTRHPAAVEGNFREDKLDKDLSAFKRMRDSGIQPSSTENAATVERYAETKWEAESGRLISDPRLRKRVVETVESLPA
jgi:hypothetical protein